MVGSELSARGSGVVQETAVPDGGGGGRSLSPAIASLLRAGLAVAFMAVILAYTYGTFATHPGGAFLIVAAVVGGYMAMNIGANDVANNVGPAVGSGAMTLLTAILMAAVFEALGAFIAGGEVVGTIKKGIIDPSLINDTSTFIWLMLAALLSAAIWLNIATYLGAPVSTTHSIVGGVLGAGIAAGGWQIAAWDKVGAIAASWVISPVLGGLIAAGFLFLIERAIYLRRNKVAAAKWHVPLLVFVMAWAFGTYLVMKGLKKLWKFDFSSALLIGLAVAVVTYLIVRPLVVRAADKLANDRDSINQLFTVPLIFAAALLSFAHGANDVANAVGPLAAINDAILHGGIAKKAAIPFWVMAIGAFGIAFGLALYGPRLVRAVGSEITKLDKMRAFCVALAAAITVIIASKLGLPVSSTHIAVGGIFGVGFLREFLEANHARKIAEIRDLHRDEKPHVVDEFLDRYEAANLKEKGQMLKELKKQKKASVLTKKERRKLRRSYRKELVKRNMVLKIVAAWLITVPVAALLAAMFFFQIRGMLLP